MYINTTWLNVSYVSIDRHIELFLSFLAAKCFVVNKETRNGRACSFVDDFRTIRRSSAFRYLSSHHGEVMHYVVKKVQLPIIFYTLFYLYVYGMYFYLVCTMLASCGHGHIYLHYVGVVIYILALCGRGHIYLFSVGVVIYNCNGRLNSNRPDSMRLALV